MLVAPPGFGKTVVSAALIAEKGVSTLIIVNTRLLLEQWQKSLERFLEPCSVGSLGGGKNTLNGKIDVAITNSLGLEKYQEVVQNYSMVIVDEAHHAASFTYVAVLKRVKAKYLYALTATPMRYDGKTALIFMPCGPFCTQLQMMKISYGVKLSPSFLFFAVIIRI